MASAGIVSQTQAKAQHVERAIARAATRTGVDFDFLMREAKLESGLDPQARARTSSATGLFQFTRQTWLGTLKAHGANHDLGWAADAITRGSDGQYRVADPALRARIFELRTQPEAAAVMAAELASDNHDFLGSRLGRTPETVDLYLAHFLGEAGAARFLEAHDANPDGAAAALLPTAAAANRSIFYRADGTARSFAEIRGNFAEKLASEAGYAPQSPLNLTQGRPYYAPQPVQQTASLAQAGNTLFADPPRLRSIEPMPQRLSLDFARDAYRRLAAMGSTS